jgi:molybdopterin-guanine dinucleotide biosynthesis protein A
VPRPQPVATVAAAILAGGRARRLGGAVKPLLLVEGRRILDRQLDVLRPLFGTIVLVANERAAFADLDLGFELPIIADRVGSGYGPLGGIDAALAFVRPPIEAVVCVAGDMPFLQPAVLRALRDAPAAGVVVPRLAGRPEPLCARYDRSFAPTIAEAIAAGRLAVHAALEGFGVTFLEEPALRALDPTLRTFVNVNTAADLG